jgi:DNA modification methylase
MTTIKPARAATYLADVVAKIHRMQSRHHRIVGSLVDRDIAACRVLAEIGWEYARQVDKIEAALTATGSKLDISAWTKQNFHCSRSTMERRKRLYKCWKEYETERRRQSDRDQIGLNYALSLIREEHPAVAINRRTVPILSERKTVTQPIIVQNSKGQKPIPCQFITGDALTELAKLAAKSVHVIISSPPYWPNKREYGSSLGHEKTLAEYKANVVAIYTEARRVLRDDGVMWLVIGDCFVNKDLQMIPAQLAMALRENGWVLRTEIIWAKANRHIPSPVDDRVTVEHEKVLMFTKKKRDYFYNTDPLRVPLVNPQAKHQRRTRFYDDRDRPGKRSGDRTGLVVPNPLGKNAGTVWWIEPFTGRGGRASFPEELPTRCIKVSCPESGVVLDMFGGFATTALAALKLGHSAIYIDINEDFTKQARARINAEMHDYAASSAS